MPFHNVIFSGRCCLYLVREHVGHYVRVFRGSASRGVTRQKGDTGERGGAGDRCVSFWENWSLQCLGWPWLFGLLIPFGIQLWSVVLPLVWIAGVPEIPAVSEGYRTLAYRPSPLQPEKSDSKSVLVLSAVLSSADMSP